VDLERPAQGLHPVAEPTRLGAAYFQLVASGQALPIPPEAFYYLVTSGGGAKYALDGMTRELFGDTALEPERIDSYAEAVADLLVRGMGNQPRGPLAGRRSFAVGENFDCLSPISLRHQVSRRRRA